MAVRQCCGRRDLELGCTDGQPQRMDRVPNARIREFCGVKKRLYERIDEGVVQWFGHVERMKNDKIAKRAYVGESAGRM